MSNVDEDSALTVRFRDGRVMDVDDFMRMPLVSRVRLILEHEVQFVNADGQLVETQVALNELRLRASSNR